MDRNGRSVRPRRTDSNPGCLICLLLCLILLPTRLAAAADPMLPQVYSTQVDIAGWWMSEKLDGVRGQWDGRRLLSKTGKPLHPPAEFVQGLPEFPLEGELWGGRGSYERTVSVVLRQTPHDGWLQLRFAVFDVPEAPGGFATRIEAARTWFAAHPTPYAFVIPQLPIRDRTHLQQELQRIEGLGGEGLIVRQPDAPYTAGRSPQILKVKSYDDAEATVIRHLPGQGKHLGRLGSLLVELADGTQFKIGTGFSDAERENPPPVGAVVTFRYFGVYPSGIPKFPSFVRVRRDAGL